MKKYNSHILTVTTESAKRVCENSYGYISSSRFDLMSFDVDDISIVSRNLLENDSNYKHIIPYVVVRQNNNVLVYQRTSSSGESRLHGNYSLGFGGHIDIGDIVTKDNGECINLPDTIVQSAYRELSEELGISMYSYEYKVVGLLYDDTNSVGSVHLGVVMEITIPDDVELYSSESQIDLKGFKSITDLSYDFYEFENWSKLIIEYLSI